MSTEFQESVIEANRRILTTGPLQPGIGGALITTVEVSPGFEHSYNRWYDDDHFYAGMMSIPWCFSGSRWIATARLRALRQPTASAFVEPISAGNFLNMYLGTRGRMEEFSDNILTALHRLLDEGRMHRDGGRRQVFTAHQDYVGAVYRDRGGPRDFHAFDYPFPACILEVVDAPSPDARDALEKWLVEEHLPARIVGSAAAMALVFRTREYRGSSYVTAEMPTDRFTRRVVVLWMLERDPEDVWDLVAHENETIAESGLGRLEFLSGYLRMIAGSDKHLDELY
ncbi:MULTISPECIES: hypothetical protein [Microbacterium]|uniref:Uncharacterized protein n=1 Tax=Microbacterium saccharophilum TaxID=1213358 RepID=A0A7Z7GFN8_9MICO|nr:MULTISPECIES: hypothetical protein [Microbacterium]SFI61367.1 hypothetical protein SAMN04487751_2391 [Microbacterium saccharophilum]